MTLHRIRALPGNKFAATGTLGGWIEKEDNLLDGAWVADEACVYGDAVVFGNTLIEDTSQVYGDAKIHGETDEILILSFDTKVHGGNWTEEPIRRIGGCDWTINPSSPDTVRIGCRDYSFERWKKSFPAIIRAYRSEQIDEKGVIECADAYNTICRRYGKESYMVDMAEILNTWHSERAKSTGFKVKDHTKRRAEEAMKEILTQWEIEANTVPAVHDPLFGEYVEKWLKKKSFDLRENSLKTYRDYANKHIIPGLGHLKVRKMTIQDLQCYYEEKLKVLSVRSLKKQHCVVSGALYEAELDQLIPANFAKDFKFPKATKFEGKAYTEDQVATLLAAVEKEGEPIRAAITLAVCYGLRREEVCGLRWQDIDFDASKLCVRNTVTQNGALKIEAERTKTQKSRRTIPLMESTVPYLREHPKVCVNLL